MPVLRTGLSAVLAALALASGGGMSAQAQGDAAAAAAADPRDLRGVWNITNPQRLTAQRTITFNSAEALTHSRMLWPVDRQAPPFTEWGQKRFDAAFMGNMNNQPLADPSTDCIPHGMPRIMIAPYPMQFVQTPGLITILFEVNHNVRLIHLDQPMPANPKITQMGYSVGRWEGSALVVETIANDARTWLDKAGLPHSEEMKVTERLQLEGADVLTDTITIDDPKTYTAPWTTVVRFNRKPGQMILEERACSVDHVM